MSGGDYFEYDPSPMLPEISVSDHKPVPTGVLDRHGRQIVRHPQPVGFHKPKGRKL